jgi:hypothetical protein
LPSAKVNYNVSIPDLAHTGIYNIVITYTWGGTGAVTSATRPFTLTLQDPCQAFMSIPTYVDQTALLLDPNTIFYVTPTITSPNYEFCQVTIALTLIRNAAADTSGFVTYTDAVNEHLYDLYTKEIVFNTVTYEPAFVGVFSVTLTYT